MTSTARNNRPSSQFMKDEYADVKQDLYGAFVVRGIELANGAGLLAIVIGDTWMSIKSFETLRQRLLTGHAFSSFVHMHDVSNHPDIFGSNAAFVLAMSGDKERLAPFIRLTSLGQDRKEAALKRALQLQTAEVGFHRSAGMHFEAIPGSPIVYWLSEKMRSVFGEGDRLGEVAALSVGLQTGDNNRFLRLWWEVSSCRTALACTSREEAASSGARWFPYNKGGEYRKWYGNQEHVVNWENDGREIRQFGAEDGGRPRSRAQNTGTYFSPSVSWSDIGAGDPSFRQFPAGFIHDVKGMSAFGTVDVLHHVVMLMNSNLSKEILRAIAPTVNFQIGDVGKVPVKVTPIAPQRVIELTQTSRLDWEHQERSWNFFHNPLIALATLQ
ncbi:BREX-1 system adenine-specific DNA-methyltransferase PglX [Pseudoclavibacter alba]|uniref:site-specific DNA-methyltransferase (adenine-specific) n=1 Tax=Pseudoclavibacter albus TaxID=272241 RepID=A0ABT2HUY5_9MICO|nr:BREX-1 system adenine-specific DNA-methyltransferase PglX [Pseudoclavibacter alba]MCT2042112.1 BREX-1 system adenine-specific DNA-methyltransferase PglX [Pseudoclavibacter alba]